MQILMRMKEYLRASHNEGWLEGEFVSEENIEIKLFNGLVHKLAIDSCLIYL